MTKSKEALENSIIKALFQSLETTDDNVRWRVCRIDSEKLAENLKQSGDLPQSISESVRSIIDNLSTRYGLNILRSDPLTLSIHGFERRFNRQNIAESLGSVGVQFFPTRQSANRCGYESAREIAYYGYGSLEDQGFACPIAQLLSSIAGNSAPELKTVILRDLRPDFRSESTVCDMLVQDKYFKPDIKTTDDLRKFQQDLRTTPLSDEAASKCESFFNQNITVGLRDSLRFLLGARHPRFGWDHASELIQAAFERYSQINFNTPQIVYYAYDPELSEDEIAQTASRNKTIADAFARVFEQALRDEDSALAARLHDKMPEIALWVLDIHHDYPDYDLESTDRSDASIQISFIGHSIQNKMNQDLLGNASETRRNNNIRAHFSAQNLDGRFFAGLTQGQIDTFFYVLDDTLSQYDKDQGVPTDSGIIMYKRLPCVLFIIQDLGNPSPCENERLLDSFNMSQMTELEHASYLRSFPDISEQLVVFFTLTLRHMMDTEHAPNLIPRNFIKDFMILGLWGSRTPNIRVNLYVDRQLNSKDLAPCLKRCEIRFTGMEQAECYPIDHHLRQKARLLRLAMQQAAPSIEASILRNLGNFVMAMEEFRSNTHAFKTDPLGLFHYGLDVFREVTQWGMRGSIKDVLTVAEYLAENTMDSLQRRLDKAEAHLRRRRKKQT